MASISWKIGALRASLLPTVGGSGVSPSSSWSNTLRDVVFRQVEKLEQVEAGAAEVVVSADEYAGAARIFEAVGDRDLADSVVVYVFPTVVLLRLAEENRQNGLQVRQELSLEWSSRRAFHVKVLAILALSFGRERPQGSRSPAGVLR